MMPMIIKRWNGFSATNQVKVYIKLNRQTPARLGALSRSTKNVVGGLFARNIQFAFDHAATIPAMSAIDAVIPSTNQY